MAHLLVTEGFQNVEEISYVDISELAAIEVDEDIAHALQERANEYIKLKEDESKDILKKLKVSKILQSLDGLNNNILIKLGENDIKSLDDFADLSRDEFIDIIPESKLKEEEIDNIIMKARQIAGWFDVIQNNI